MTPSLRRALLLCACLLLQALAAAPAAWAQATGPVRSASSGQCLDVTAASATPGAAVIQWGCHGAPNQQWQASWANGYYSFKVASSGQCLDVYGGSTAAGAALIQWTCSGAANQQFTLRGQGSGYALVARHSGLCVAVDAGSQTPGARIVQQTCTGSAAQTWTLDGIAASASQGSWNAVQTLSIVPVAAANLPNGRVLFWSAYDRLSFGGDNGRTYTSIYDPDTGTASEVLVTNTGHDMFCPGIANLPDGRIHVTGGSSSTRTSLYDPATNSWSMAAAMNLARGYQGSVTLATGDVFTIGGSWSGGQGNKDAEVWNAASNTWRRTWSIWDDYILTADAGGIYRADNHAWLFAASGGRIFHAGPSQQMNWFTTDGNGSVTPAGNRAADGHAMNGNAVMFDVNRILTVGGAPNYENNDATANAHLIDIASATPVVTKLASMSYARAYHNSVVLPDGKVIVIGGQSYPVPFSDDRSVLVPELFDPATRTFRTVAPMAQARNYHSTALLLPDGRVLSGGGGLCGGCATNHPNVQVWSPPYLFNADGTAATRPTLTSAPTTASAGTSVTVTTRSAVSGFTLMRLSSVTHSVNNEQRRVPVSFTTTGTNRYALALPADRGVLVPGHYMLFALNAAGVPSASRTLRIN